MQNLRRLEELAVFILSIYLFSRLPFAWWVYPVCFLIPDISFAGFLGGKKVGMVAYNVVHHRALAVGIYLLGTFLSIPGVALAGVVLLGHASLDRVLGYGLVDPDEPNRFNRSAAKNSR